MLLQLSSRAGAEVGGSFISDRLCYLTDPATISPLFWTPHSAFFLSPYFEECSRYGQLKENRKNQSRYQVKPEHGYSNKFAFPNDVQQNKLGTEICWNLFFPEVNRQQHEVSLSLFGACSLPRPGSRLQLHSCLPKDSTFKELLRNATLFALFLSQHVFLFNQLQRFDITVMQDPQ